MTTEISMLTYFFLVFLPDPSYNKEPDSPGTKGRSGALILTKLCMQHNPLRKGDFMKKFLLAAAAVILVLSLLCGCSKPQESPTPAVTSPSATVPAETAPAETGSKASSLSPDAVYAQQIGRYYTAISQQWDEGAYFEQEMSAMAAYYYEGNALDNVGYAFMDLDGDKVPELMIGAIANAAQSPLVFEIWTVKDGQPVMLAQSGSRNRYYLQHSEEDGLWSIAYEGENGAANHAVHYLHLAEGELAVIQGVIFDAMASEDAPWFMTYDLDWDVSNDVPIDEDTANAIMDAERSRYTAIGYIPYSMYS